MMKQVVLFVALCCVWMHVEARSKYVTAEEDNPYEFGFTIDGQQHRHEKKDANGVIQGEFGFITADGIYHVTVYATDENGNFKILSMRNVRVSGRLDEPNAKLPDTSQVAKGQPNPAPNPLSIQTTPAPAQTIPPVTQSNRFTTQPTIKPACAGCGYVTHATPLKKPDSALQFQTQAGQNPRPQDVIIGEKSPQPQVQHQSQGQSGVRPAVSSNSGFNVPPGSNAPFVSDPIGTKPGSQGSPNRPGPNAVGQFNPPNKYPDSSPIHSNQNYPSQSGQQNYPGNTDQFAPQSGLNTSPDHTLDEQNTSDRNTPLQQQQPQTLQDINQGTPRVLQSPQQTPEQPQTPVLRPLVSDQFSNDHKQPQQPQTHLPGQHQDTLRVLQSDRPTPEHSNTQQLLHQPTDHQQQPHGDSDNQDAVSPSTLNIPISDPSQISGNNNNYNQPQEDPLLNPLSISNPPNHLNQPQTDNGITVSNGMINVPGNAPIQIQDKYPNMVDGLPAGIKEGDITDLLYRFNYTVGFHGHYEKGYKNGAKVGGYFVNDRDGVSRIVTYVADENGYRPKVKFIRLDLNSDLVPKEGTEKTFGLKNFEFVWYPLN